MGLPVYRTSVLRSHVKPTRWSESCESCSPGCHVGKTEWSRATALPSVQALMVTV